MKFRLLQGKHNEGGKIYKKGDIVDTPFDLGDRFGEDRFEVCRESLSALREEFQKGEGEEDTSEEEVSEIRRVSLVGEDVTESFDVDSEVFQVVKDGRRYNILVDGDMIASDLWKKDVAPACEDYLEE